MSASQLPTIVRQLRSAVLGPNGDGQADDLLLAAFLARREESAFEALVRRHGPMVLGVCQRVLRNEADADDALQATFLVFLRRAASIRPRGMVGNWLHGVAFRTALEAKRRAARRRLKESAVPPRIEGPGEDTTGLREILDDELQRLPTHFRTVLVLSDLEGMARAEVARQLGWPEGTVASRLARARARLAKRLARRGLALSAGSLAALLSQDALSASLVSSTVKAAGLTAAGRAAADAIPATTAALVEGVLKNMLHIRMSRMAALLVVTVALAIGTGLVVSQASGTAEPQNKAIQVVQAPPKGTATVTASEIGTVYTTNAALADQKFRGKRVTVSGQLIRIKRKGIDAKDRVVYELLMESVRAGGKIRPFDPYTLLSFEFKDEVRDQLAKLTHGQRLTVEARAEGYDLQEEKALATVYFFDSKLVKAGD